MRRHFSRYALPIPRGFTTIALLLVVISIAVVIGTGWYATRHVPSVLNQAVGQTVVATTTPKTPVAPPTANAAALLADCRAATPILDAKGNVSGARLGKLRVWVSSDQYSYGGNMPGGEHFDVNKCGLALDADPTTFVALDLFYGKDTKGVWIIANPSEEGSLISAKLAGADSATFTLIHDSQDSEGYSSSYTKDAAHVYTYGQIVSGADPTTFTIVDPPQHYKPLPTNFLGDPNVNLAYDAKDAQHEYFRGQVVP